MTIQVREIRRSRRFDNQAATLEFVIYGTDDSLVAWVEANRAAPPEFIGLVRDQITVAPLDADESVFECRVEYREAKKIDYPQTNAEEISFDIEAADRHITHSLATVSSYGAAGSTPPNFGQGIEFRDGLFQGTTVMAPRLGFTITKYLPVDAVTNSLIASWRAAAFKVNDSLWRGQPARTCMFMGCSGSRRNSDDYAIAFKFQAAEHLEDISVGAITGIDREAWDHMWVLSEPLVDESAKYLSGIPQAVYVERVYQSVNFPTALGLTA